MSAISASFRGLSQQSHLLWGWSFTRLLFAMSGFWLVLIATPALILSVGGGAWAWTLAGGLFLMFAVWSALL
jgi:hypothetical protein